MNYAVPESSSPIENQYPEKKELELNQRRLRDYGLEGQDIDRLRTIAFETFFKESKSLEEDVLGFVVEKADINSQYIDLSEIIEEAPTRGDSVKI